MIHGCCERCGTSFSSVYGHARFCSERCRRKAKEVRRLRTNKDYAARRQQAKHRRTKKRYASDPAYRERQRTWYRAYYDKRRDEILERKRLARLSDPEYQQRLAQRQARAAEREAKRIAFYQARAERQALILQMGLPQYEQMRKQRARWHSRISIERNPERARARWRRYNRKPERIDKNNERKRIRWRKRKALITALTELGWLLPDGNVAPVPPMPGE